MNGEKLKPHYSIGKKWWNCIFSAYFFLQFFFQKKVETLDLPILHCLILSFMIFSMKKLFDRWKKSFIKLVFIHSFDAEHLKYDKRNSHSNVAWTHTKFALQTYMYSFLLIFFVSIKLAYYDNFPYLNRLCPFYLLWLQYLWIWLMNIYASEVINNILSKVLVSRYLIPLFLFILHQWFLLVSEESDTYSFLLMKNVSENKNKLYIFLGIFHEKFNQKFKWKSKKIIWT